MLVGAGFGGGAELWEEVGFHLFDRGRLVRLSARYYADCRMRYLLVALTFPLAPLAGQDFGRLRERMVHEQIEARGVGSPEVLAAMRSVHRHLDHAPLLALSSRSFSDSFCVILVRPRV
jgi:hypothetical protein